MTEPVKAVYVKVETTKSAMHPYVFEGAPVGCCETVTAHEQGTYLYPSYHCRLKPAVKLGHRFYCKRHARARGFVPKSEVKS